MGLREDISFFANELKRSEGYSYSDLENLTGCTRKQVSSILNAHKGVSFDKIEEFFIKAFDTKLHVNTTKILDESE